MALIRGLVKEVLRCLEGKQRLALARAFYHDRSLLILDEATSALDKHTEEEVFKEIFMLKKKSTIIIISHNESNLKSCDIIFEVKHGKITKI